MERKKVGSHLDLALEAAGEGMVLLQNDGTLPLKAAKIALFGNGALFAHPGGTGSGTVNGIEPLSVKDAFLEEGIVLSDGGYFARLMAAKEAAKAEKERRLKEAGRDCSVFEWAKLLSRVWALKENEPSAPIESADLAEASGLTAVYVLSRQAGEGQDREAKRGDYYLSEQEKEDLSLLKANYAALVIVLNVGSPIDLAEIKSYAPNAIVYMGQAGGMGALALVRLLLGKINFSGKLPVSWPESLDDLPATPTFGRRGRADKEPYLEGIYVGYRFHDSFGIPAACPFGYGLSYSKFEIKGEASLEGTDVVVKVRVENVSEVPGKEVVQLYLSAPKVALDKEYQSLMAFGKTPLLMPGEAASLVLRFPMEDAASFDEEAGAYLLEEGEYVLRLGNSSANSKAISRILLSKRILVEKGLSLYGGRKAVQEIAPPVRREERKPDSALVLNPRAFTPRIHSAAAPKAEPGPEEHYLDRWKDSDLARLLIGDRGLVENKILDGPGACGEVDRRTARRHGLEPFSMCDGPAGLRIFPRYYVEPSGKITAPGMIPSEMIVAKSLYRLVDRIVSRHGKKARLVEQKPTFFPTASLLAASWDENLLFRVGEAVAEEMRYYGQDVWLAPAMNIVRYPLCGRNFEYYSEDPLLTAKMASAIVRGVESQGDKAACIKHFCCNNREDNREKNSSEVNERALREIYLKAFRRVVKEAHPSALMTSYNLLNGTYVSNDARLVKDLLRGEWGYDGLIMTDWGNVKEGQAKAPLCLKAGVNMVMPGGKYELKEMLAALRDGTISHEELVEGCLPILRLMKKLA